MPSKKKSKFYFEKRVRFCEKIFKKKSKFYFEKRLRFYEKIFKRKSKFEEILKKFRKKFYEELFKYFKLCQKGFHKEDESGQRG